MSAASTQEQVANNAGIGIMQWPHRSRVLLANALGRGGRPATLLETGRVTADTSIALTPHAIAVISRLK